MAEAEQSSLRVESANAVSHPLLPIFDLTQHARDGQLEPMVSWGTGDPLERFVRGLYQTERRHLLITGPSGVGKTTLVKQLARRMGGGEIPFRQSRSQDPVFGFEVSDLPGQFLFRDRGQEREHGMKQPHRNKARNTSKSLISQGGRTFETPLECEPEYRVTVHTPAISDS